MDFKSTFIFCAFKTWGSELFDLAIQNRFAVTIMSGFITGGAVVANTLLQESWFGTTYLVLLLVHITLFGNAWSGIKKNKIKSSIFFAKAQACEPETRHYRLNIKRWKSHEFDMKKLYFVFFKSLSFLVYLLVVKSLTMDTGSGAWYIQSLEIGAEALIKIPIFLFWYYEFKSIGENTEYIFGQKASIFTIVEKFVEPKIFKMYGSTTPTDGKNEPPTSPRL